MASKEQVVLQSLISNGQVPSWRLDFASSLAFYTRPLSQKQEFHLNKMIKEIVEPEAKPPATSFDVSKIVKLFEGAKKHLKYPKVTLQTAKSQFTIVAKLSSEKSKYPGSIMLNAGAFGSPFYGSIKANGELWIAPAGSRIKDELVELLKEFANAPAQVAAKYGKLTSRCCFCGLTLSTPESLAVGYGDTCASHWGMPWGKDKKSSADILKAVDVLMTAEAALAVPALGVLADDLINDFMSDDQNFI